MVRCAPLSGLMQLAHYRVWGVYNHYARTLRMPAAHIATERHDQDCVDLNECVHMCTQ
jgi:hypothetical protein